MRLPAGAAKEIPSDFPVSITNIPGNGFAIDARGEKAYPIILFLFCNVRASAYSTLQGSMIFLRAGKREANSWS